MLLEKSHTPSLLIQAKVLPFRQLDRRDDAFADSSPRGIVHPHETLNGTINTLANSTGTLRAIRTNRSPADCPPRPFLATRTDSHELQSVPDNLVTRRARQRFFKLRLRREHRVLDPPAFNTTNMIMPRHVSVEAPLPSCHVDFRYQAGIAENLQVAVHRAQANPRQPSSHHTMKFIRRRMRLRFPQYVQDDLPLSCHPEHRPL